MIHLTVGSLPGDNPKYSFNFRISLSSMYRMLLIVFWYFITVYFIAESHLLGDKFASKGTLLLYIYTKFHSKVQSWLCLYSNTCNSYDQQNNPINVPSALWSEQIQTKKWAGYCRNSLESGLSLLFRSISVNNCQDIDTSLQFFTFPWMFFNFLFAITEISLLTSNLIHCKACFVKNLVPCTLHVILPHHDRKHG